MATRLLTNHGRKIAIRDTGNPSKREPDDHVSGGDPHRQFAENIGG
jgi:hypothetical protein